MPKEQGRGMMVLETPLGPLAMTFVDFCLARVDFVSDQVVSLPYARQPDFMQRVVDWFKSYFSVPAACSELPLLLEGTPFQIRVWEALKAIPLGGTETYGSLAQRLKTSPRAIGMACRQNPLPIVIPCHRVVSRLGLGGYCGQMEGLTWSHKPWLLMHEARESNALKLRKLRENDSDEQII